MSFTGYSFLNNYIDYSVSGSVTEADTTQSLVVMAVTDDDVPGGDVSSLTCVSISIEHFH